MTKGDGDEIARAQTTKAALQRPLGLRLNGGEEGGGEEGGGEEGGGEEGGGEEGGGSRSRTVSVFPIISINRNRSPFSQARMKAEV
ncbi:hypothetical protein PG984_001491 [Apiospora sp. TS-2023a]